MNEQKQRKMKEVIDGEKHEVRKTNNKLRNGKE